MIGKDNVGGAIRELLSPLGVAVSNETRQLLTVGVDVGRNSHVSLISTAFAVMAMECSQWAAMDPSKVSTVQPSSVAPMPVSVVVALEPR